MNYDPDSPFSNPLARPLAQLPRGPKLKAALEAEIPRPPDSAVRDLPPEDRLARLSRLRTMHFPLKRDVALTEMFLDLLLDGYAERAPTAANAEREVAAVQSFASKLVYADESDHEAMGFAVIGISSAGKTRTVKRVLRRFPQVAYHSVDKNPLLPVLSVIWLRVECPSNRSLLALAKAIIKAIEAAIKQPVPAKLKEGNKSELITNAASLCAEFKLGMLVIDEIQHALGKDGKPDEELMNFLVQLSNELNIPIVLVGTPRARHVIGGEMRQARRMLGPEWRNFSRESDSWSEFSGRLLDYQYTSAVAPKETIAPTLYDLSQGLPGLAVMLWRTAQRYSILMEMEGNIPTSVTPEILTAVYDDFFDSVKPMIAALRSGNPERIAFYQDLHVDAESLEVKLAEAAAGEVETMRMKLFKARQAALAKGKKIIKTALQAQTEALSGAPLNPVEQNTPLLDAFDKAKEDGEDPGAAVAAAM